MNAAPERLNVVLYVRVSSEEQKQGHNIDSQIAELRQFAAQREWPVMSIYQDEAWSGAVLERPALDRLRDDARKKLFDAVMINDVDRLARDVTHLGVIKRDLERSGVRVIFRKIPSENSPTHNLLVNILGSFAEFERELIMDRTRRGRRHKVETRQLFMGSLAPYGYRYTPGIPGGPPGKLAVSPEEATVVRMMFDWVVSDGISAREVALRLTSKGVRPRKGGVAWQRSSVLHVLRGTIYIGTWNYNKHKLGHRRALLPVAEPSGKKTSSRLRPKDEWISVKLPDSLKIIPSDKWQRVQQQLDRNRTFSRRNSKHEYLLSGLVRCGGCQSSFCGNPSHGRFQYRCVKRCKRVPLVSEATLDASVWNPLERALKNPELLVRAIEQTDQPSRSGNEAETQIGAALDGVRNEEARVLEAYRLSILTPDQLSHELELIASRRQMLERQREESNRLLHPTTPVLSSIEESCKEIQRKLQDLTFETKRNIVRLLIRAVIFEGDEVRISGVIPMSDHGGIVNTEIDLCERNAAPPLIANFTLVTPVVRDLTARLAASRANLIKASSARWLGHRAKKM